MTWDLNIWSVRSMIFLPTLKQIIGCTEQQPIKGIAGKAWENLDVNNLLHIVTKCTKQLFHSMYAIIKLWTLWQNIVIWTSMYTGTSDRWLQHALTYIKFVNWITLSVTYAVVPTVWSVDPLGSVTSFHIHGYISVMATFKSFTCFVKLRNLLNWWCVHFTRPA